MYVLSLEQAQTINGRLRLELCLMRKAKATFGDNGGAGWGGHSKEAVRDVAGPGARAPSGTEPPPGRPSFPRRPRPARGVRRCQTGTMPQMCGDVLGEIKFLEEALTRPVRCPQQVKVMLTSWCREFEFCFPVYFHTRSGFSLRNPHFSFWTNDSSGVLASVPCHFRESRPWGRSWGRGPAGPDSVAHQSDSTGRLRETRPRCPWSPGRGPRESTLLPASDTGWQPGGGAAWALRGHPGAVSPRRQSCR